MSKRPELETYLKGIEERKISILAKAITLVESQRLEDQRLAQRLIEAVMPLTGRAKRLAVSGPPGVGKSSFIESFGRHLTAQGLKLAVLAVDPSSKRSGGSILGDKTRMGELALDDNAFIRPSPSGESLGGITAKTWEALLLCEAFGFDVIIIETVGVGQSETMVSRLVDVFLLLMQPGGGDDLQGIKRGIMEVADLICVNKADTDQLELARQTAQNCKTALSILRPDKTPPVLLCSAKEKSGLDQVWRQVEDFYQSSADYLRLKRQKQLELWIRDMVLENIQRDLDEDQVIKMALQSNQKAVLENKKSALKAAQDVYAEFKKLRHLKKS